ncbi:hypothetical protein ACGFNP_25070 [Nonomuraea sp. NPDC049269]|uniref:hypothetical protein n=1 Tax=Nonomuraea sp. NPDC049269 TaxID=3364349 RepID=UPI00371F9CFA
MPDEKISNEDRRRKSAKTAEACVNVFARATRRRDGYDAPNARPRSVELFEVEDD